jgi:hypothetical protein
MYVRNTHVFMRAGISFRKRLEQYFDPSIKTPYEGHGAVYSKLSVAMLRISHAYHCSHLNSDIHGFNRRMATSKNMLVCKDMLCLQKHTLLL